MSGRHGCGFFGVTERISLVCFCFGFLLCGLMMVIGFLNGYVNFIDGSLVEWDGGWVVVWLDDGGWVVG